MDVGRRNDGVSGRDRDPVQIRYDIADGCGPLTTRIWRAG
jgi:hypothetical protein